MVEFPSETQDCFCRKIIWSRTATFNRSSEEYFAEISRWWSDIKGEFSVILTFLLLFVQCFYSCGKILHQNLSTSGCGHVGTAVRKMPFKIGEVISKINDV